MADDPNPDEIVKIAEKAASDHGLAGIIGVLRDQGIVPQETLDQMRVFMKARFAGLGGVSKEAADAYATHMDRLLGEHPESAIAPGAGKERGSS